MSIAQRGKIRQNSAISVACNIEFKLFQHGKKDDKTQLAAHSIADGKSLSQFWRAGDVGCIRTTTSLPISMAEFDNRRTVTHIW